MIEVKNLCKYYGDFCAVKDISFTVNKGEVFGFLGINGAGKTTTLRILAGVLEATSGAVSIGGHDLIEEATKAKSITGYIPDRPYIYTKLSGREFLKFIADLYHIDRQVAAKRMEELFNIYGLNNWQDELVDSYSHGMKQRLATCAALIHSPEVLIIDEPMVGLDPHGAKLLKKSMRAYAEQGMSVMLSTHSLNVAEEVSDRVAIIHNGTILTIGTLEQLREEAGRQDENLENVFLQLTSPTIERKHDEVGLPHQ